VVKVQVGYPRQLVSKTTSDKITIISINGTGKNYG